MLYNRYVVRSIVTIRLFIFFFNDTATTEIYTLSLHDALPIYEGRPDLLPGGPGGGPLDAHLHQQRVRRRLGEGRGEDRKSTRLNSSHANISYAVFCLKKKKI